MEFLTAFIEFLGTYTAELGGGAALAAIIEYFFKPIRRLFGRTPKESPPPVAPPVVSPRQAAGHDVAYFINVQKALKAALEAELTTAHEDEKQTLRARITELESQIQNPDAALEAAQKRVVDLEARLARMGNEIGGDRLEQAREALARFDYSVADEIFAEVEARNELVVQETARAAFGRGEVAEAEIRWHDAAEHYARAAQLSPDWDNVEKAQEFAWRAGDYQTALTLCKQLIVLAETEENRATALNNKAAVLEQLGRFPEAEQLYAQALEIDKATIGEAHPDYATSLNNLASVLRAQARYDEAEQLFTQALEIDKATIGEAHPDYAIDLNNLAMVVKAQGRYGEAEQLFTQALEIDKATIGEAHPSYATHLNNLAAAVEALGRYDEAERLYTKALEIDKATIGEAHPQFAIDLSNLAGVLVKLDRRAEAGPMYEETLRIFETTLPPDHPHIATVKEHIAAFNTPD